MGERGILFTPENYGKCADGSKTQTRRILKPQPPEGSTIWQSEGIGDQWQVRRCDPWHSIKCPFGTVGDRLYAKEGLETPDGFTVRYRLDQAVIANYPWRWERDTLSPLHMPKWAARLWLEITEVRVERLHEISDADAIAEGCDLDEPTGCADDEGSGVKAFRALWESNKIHKPGSWELNSFVWVISFASTPHP